MVLKIDLMHKTILEATPIEFIYNTDYTTM